MELTLMLVLYVAPKSLYITVCTSEIHLASQQSCLSWSAQIPSQYKHQCAQLQQNCPMNTAGNICNFISNSKELFVCMLAIVRVKSSRRCSSSDEPLVLCVLDFCTISPSGSRSGQLCHPGAHPCRPIPKR